MADAGHTVGPVPGSGETELFFRLRPNGALVFRVDPENRMRRVDLSPVATVNERGVIKPQGRAELTEAERAAIAAWSAARQEVLRQREFEEIRLLVERLNLAAHWVQTRAEDHEIDAVMGDLLMAMHDLRAALVRRKAQSLIGDDGAEG